MTDTEAADRRSLAELLLRQRLRAERDQQVIVARPRPEEPVPLSLAQRRIWLFEQLRPEAAVYNELLAVRLRGRLDSDLVERGAQEVVRRHEILRSAVVLAGDGPAQVVVPDAALALDRRDFGSIPTVRREEAALDWIRAQARRPFDLTRPPLLRVQLARLADDDHLLAITVHHVVSDGWSMRILLRELWDGYRAHALGLPPDLPDLPIQYADFARWQHGRLDEGALAAQLDYWRGELAGAPPELELPHDHERPPLPSHTGRERTFAVPAAQTRALEELAGSERATLFMVLLTAFQVLLSRYSGQDDVVVATPVAGRPGTDTEPLIGCFVNTLALRARLDGDPTFREALRRVRAAVLGAFANQDVPMEVLVEELVRGRDPRRNPLFQVLFALHDGPFAMPEPEGLVVRPLAGLHQVAKFDLTLALVPGRDGLTGHLEYATDLFEEATIQRLAAHFRVLLDGVVADPDRRISELPLLTEPERAAILAHWHGPDPVPRTDACLHELFEAQARRTPANVAVVDGDRRVSYADLDGRADVVAGWLRRRGCGRGTLVALCLEPGVDLVVAILATLKAGAAYLPLDPGTPADRVGVVLADARPAVLLTQRHLEPDLPRTEAVDVVAVDGPRGPTAVDHGPVPEPARVRPTDLAYVIYTSGSTGAPKGVLIEHRNVVRLFTATEPWFGFSDRDVWSLFHSSAFDVSVWELFGALLYGGRLVTVPRAARRSPSAFCHLLAAEGVTVLSQTPTAFYALTEAEGPRITTLRLVVLEGERLDFRRLAGWFDRYPEDAPRVVNMLGPTETAVHATYRPIRRADVTSARSYVGEPIPDLRLMVVDPNLRPVPVGVPGELLLAGAGVGRGYLRRPDLTAARFVPDPLGGDLRCYRTGDLVRRTADGDLEYLRRMDDQLKVRGFRVEPGEIEAVLRGHPRIADAVVTLASDAGGHRLAAHLVADGTPPPARELRQFLLGKLPDYMVPSAYLFVPDIPLTLSGKVDRRALPPAEPVGPDQPYLAPRNDTERLLADTWARVLDVERIGIDDNFFDVGGHSLLAIKAQQRLRERGAVVDAIEIFQFPTVRALARHLASTGDGDVLSQARGRGAARRAMAAGRRDRTRGSQEER